MTHNHSNLHGEDPATGSPVPGERTNPTQTASTMPGDGQLSAGGAAHNSVLLTEVSSENDALEVLFQAVHDQTEQESDSASFQAPHEPVPQLHQETLLETWSQCYLVRRGWLTADEALNYTNLSVSFLREILCSWLTVFWQTVSSAISLHYHQFSPTSRLMATSIMI